MIIAKTAEILERVRKHLSRFEESKVSNLERAQRISQVIEKVKAKYHISEKPPELYIQLETADEAFGGLDKLKGVKR